MPPKKPFRISGELHFNYINDEDLRECYDCIEKVMFEYKGHSMLSTVSVLSSILRDITIELSDRSSFDTDPTVLTPPPKRGLKKKLLHSPVKRV